MSGAQRVVGLVQAGDLSRDEVGGKAAALGVLAGAGYAVPAGFVLTATRTGDVDADQAPAVLAAADRLGPGPFAVRSSAVAEDLPDASYAGLYETYLNVHRHDLVGAVQRCAASAAAPRVRAYRSDRMADDGAREPADAADRAGIAVLVQQMVDATAAGVAFTANPVSGDRAEVVVTAVRGLGEPLVSGEAIGEEWVVRDGQPRLSRSGDDVLTQPQARAVAALAVAVAARSGVPQDIEWAIDQHGRLYLLQARPMTALADPVSWAPPGPGRWVRNFRLGEWLPEAMTPLFADWPLHRIEAGYLDGMRSCVGAVVPFRYAAVNGWYYNAAPVPSGRLLARVSWQSRGRALGFLFSALVRVSRNPVAADRALLAELYRRWRTQLLPTYVRLVEDRASEVEEASPGRLVEIVDEVARTAGEYLWYLAVVGGSAWKIEGALGRFCRNHLAQTFADTPALAGGPQLLLRGLPGAEPALPSHAVHSVDWYHPTTGEVGAPGGTLGAAGGDDRHTGLATARVVAEGVCQAALRAQPRLHVRFTGLLRVAQRYAVIREEQARDLTLGWPVLRRCVHRLGAHLRAQGVIAAADDIFFLTSAELQDAVGGVTRDLGSQVRRRRAGWERQCRLPAPLTLGIPPRLIGDPIARAVEAARVSTSGGLDDGWDSGGDDGGDDAIIGQPASIGRATGPVRIVTGPADFAAFAAGEVLVAKVTAPAWTPLFARAAAVVTDGGTLAAHASLVAREYGIPAVVGTGDATCRLRTGQRVTVDGNAGTVRPERSTSRGAAALRR